MLGARCGTVLRMSEIEACFADDARIAAALRFERELAAALAEHGAITANAATAIARACESFDATGLSEAAEHAGTLAIPLVERLRAAVGEHASAVHRGATSQDVADTALVLQIAKARPLVEIELDGLVAALAGSARQHARTPVMGRTLLQPAEVIGLGVRFATWYRGVVDARGRLTRELESANRVQLGGAIGTLASLGSIGPAVRTTLAQRLGLADAPSWHARRDVTAGLASAIAIVVGALGKIARDISLLSAMGEMAEPRVPGRGGSSAMPHKHNPTGCIAVLAATARTSNLAATIVGGMPQELERGLGGWQAEAPVIAELFVLAHRSARAMREVVVGLEVQPAAPPGDHAAALDASVRLVDELLTT